MGLKTRVQVIEIDIAILAASSEAHIVWEPIDTHDSLHVTLELHTLSAIVGIEIVHMNMLFVSHSCEKVTSISESNLVAALDKHDFAIVNLVAQDVANIDLVLQSYN